MNPGEQRATVDAAHRQASHQLRLDWGPMGGHAISEGADIAVVVDVLSFTTTLSIAISRGTAVHPFPWEDERAAAYAHEHGAVLAVGRLEARDLAGKAPPSLSPAQFLASDPIDRVVLPSPNGSTICAALRSGSPDLAIVGASFRNRDAVARWLRPQVAAGKVIAFVPAGERWPDGSLRPALEDLWGAGAVLAHLAGPCEAATTSMSPEARHAASSYAPVAADIGVALEDCASGQELIAREFAEDVTAAADLDADDVVPHLTAGAFSAAAQPTG